MIAELTNKKPPIFAEGAKWYGRSSQKSFCFLVAYRSANIAIIEKWFRDRDEFDSFEVVRIREHKKERLIKGKVVASVGQEYLPKDEEWGSHGWTYKSLEKAHHKLDKIMNEL